MSLLEPVWAALDATVESGWAPGVVAGVRHRGELSFHATGTTAFGSAEPLHPDTQFRTASLTKPIGGVVALSLVADGVFGLDDPVAPWLPELAEPRVLRRIDGPLDDTVPCAVPITVRHLLTMSFGLGLVLADCPLAAAVAAAGINPGPVPPTLAPDEYLAAVGALPLAFQPGDGWLYHTGADVLAVLVARASGEAVPHLVERIVASPLGLTRTGFVTDRPLPTAYLPTSDGLQPFTAPGYDYREPPTFPGFGAGLVSTVPDYLAFLAALADGRLLPPDLQAEMTSDQLSPAQREMMTPVAGPGRSWGLLVGLDIERTFGWTAPGRYGWTGGSGTSAFVDPSRDLIGVVFTQRMMSRGDEPFDWFWGPLVEAVDRGGPPAG